MRRRCTLISLVALLLPACASPEANELDSAALDYDLDQRMTEADLPDLPDNAEVWWGPEVVIEPYSESMYCLFGTYS